MEGFPLGRKREFLNLVLAARERALAFSRRNRTILKTFLNSQIRHQTLNEPQRLELLNHLQKQPRTSQRELAQAFGVSLGKANYCLRALIDKGLIKFGNFRKNPDKRQYGYLLTPAGLKEKTRITLKFLRRKLADYDALGKEIEHLRNDLEHRRIEPEDSFRSKKA